MYADGKKANGAQPVRISAAPNEPHWNPVMLPQADHIDLFFKVGRPIAVGAPCV